MRLYPRLLETQHRRHLHLTLLDLTLIDYLVLSADLFAQLFCLCFGGGEGSFHDGGGVGGFLGGEGGDDRGGFGGVEDSGVGIGMGIRVGISVGIGVAVLFLLVDKGVGEGQLGVDWLLWRFALVALI